MKKAYIAHFDAFKIASAIEDVIAFARRCNKYIDETAPWALAKEESQKSRLATVLYELLAAIRQIANFLKPFMPDTAAEILRQLNTTVEETIEDAHFSSLSYGIRTEKPVPLFARLDEAEKQKEIEELQKRNDALNAANAAAVKLTDDGPETEQKPEIVYDDFDKCDLVVAEVKSCEKVKKSEKLLCFSLDDGTDTPRQILSGIAKYYRPEDLIGKKVVIVANLKPRKMCGLESAGMILSTESAEDGSIRLLTVDSSVPNGSRIG